MANIKKTITGIIAAIQLASTAYAAPVDNFKDFDKSTKSQIINLQEKGKAGDLEKDFAKLNEEFISIKANILRWEAFSKEFSYSANTIKISYSGRKLQQIQESENKTVLEVLQQTKSLYSKYGGLAAKYKLNLEDILPNLEILSSTIVKLYIEAIDNIRIGNLVALNMKGESAYSQSDIQQLSVICAETLDYLGKMYKITEDPAIKVAISNWKSFTQKLVSMKK